MITIREKFLLVGETENRGISSKSRGERKLGLWNMLRGMHEKKNEFFAVPAEHFSRL